MTTTVLLAIIKKLEGKVDSLETISFEPVTELPETGEPNVIYLVPKSDPETGNYSDEYIWDSNNQSYEKIGDTMIYPLPDVTSIDNGKVLGVVDGEWAVYTIPKELPAVSSSDNGKILGVSSGVWTKINPAPNANTNIAPDYSSSLTYNKGDLVIYNNTLYECIVSIKTAENWTAAHWEVKTVADEFASIENEINGCDVYDNIPYNFRTAGGTLEIGDREYDTLVGGTVVFNQLVQNGNFANNTTNWSGYGNKTVSNNVCRVTALDFSMYLYQTINNKTQGHKIAVLFNALGSKNLNMDVNWGDKLKTVNLTTSNARYSVVASVGAGNNNLNFQNYTCEEGDYFELSNVNLIDLTQMFGSTIADYIYSLEQATAGSGVAYFRSLFPKDYYAYNAGQLMSVKALSHKMVGFNAFNVTTGKAKLLGGNRYQITGTYTALSYSTGETLTPDSNGKFTPSESGELTVTGGDNTTCVHLVWDGERDGEYEAYSEHIYPLDSDLELRGIPKLDANNNLYYDGDTYESDGTVTRKYGVVDLGSLDWSGYGARGQFYANIPLKNNSKPNINIICEKYYCYGNGISSGILNTMPDKSCAGFYNASSSNSWVYVKDTAYTDTTTFKTAMSGVYLVYELATPTTETADAFENPQLVDNWGTEEYTDSRAVQIPVGHITKYPRGIKSLMAIMEQEIEEAKELPEVSSADEGKVLTVDSNGNWVTGNIPDGSNTSY